MIGVVDIGGLRRLCAALLVSMLADCPIGAGAQEGIPSTPPSHEAARDDAAAAGATNQELLERLLEVEQAPGRRIG